MKQHIKAYERRVDLLRQSLSERYPDTQVTVVQHRNFTQFVLHMPKSTEVCITTDQEGEARIWRVMAKTEDGSTDTVLRAINRINRGCRATTFVYDDYQKMICGRADLWFQPHLHYGFDAQVLGFLNRFLRDCDLYESVIARAAEGDKYCFRSEWEDDDEPESSLSDYQSLAGT